MTRDYDFIGFTYGGKHSIDDFGIYRTSDGDRYVDNLIPQLNDKTADIPGGEGQYYFYSRYKNRTFNISIAFDSLSEEKYQEVRKWLNGKEIKELVFDETPYKVYSAKVTGTPSLKTLCFEEGGKRVYKGDGSITFTCYYPYAHTPSATLSGGDGKSAKNYLPELYPTKDQWLGASKLKNEHQPGDNCGNLEAPFIYKSTNVRSFSAGDILTVGELQVTLLENCDSLEWDSRTGLVVGQTASGIRPIKISGKSYGGIPVGGIGEMTMNLITVEGEQAVIYLLNNRKIIGNREVSAISPFTLEYNYWYY